MFPFSPRASETYQELVITEGVFSPAECEEIIELGAPSKAGRVMNDESAGVRDSKVGWIEMDERGQWVYERIARTAMEVNNRFFQFELSGMNERPQVAEYEPGGFYDWHMDYGAGVISMRKLSVVVQLTDPLAYEGGGLEFLGGQMSKEDEARRDRMIRQQGAVVIFPPFVTHRVRPVTSGVRYSLACWISGPAFR